MRWRWIVTNNGCMYRNMHPASIDPAKARERLEQVLTVLPALLELPPEQVFLKVRQRRREPTNTRSGLNRDASMRVHEGAACFWVNFTDYLDTGLFLDHRITRQELGELATGRHFLNLFGYTGTATVCAALGGAASTTTVDLSSTYLDWARRNLELNGIRGPHHTLIRADCRQWLDQARECLRLDFSRPADFSNSKRLPESFDVQQDHAGLLRQTLRLLAPGRRADFLHQPSRVPAGPGRSGRSADRGWSGARCRPTCPPTQNPSLLADRAAIAAIKVPSGCSAQQSDCQPQPQPRPGLRHSTSIPPSSRARIRHSTNSRSDNRFR